ncbi:hypothetical protein [Cellulomonas sp. HZM]|uniref:hypothetical protein n=1 Tax=Cellulomonas sp. HZM TaxID=1454010 RepID=UPI00068F4F89|nr:hypothetical protein [Cellulomonas sp. HZM]
MSDESTTSPAPSRRGLWWALAVAAAVVVVALVVVLGKARGDDAAPTSPAGSPSTASATPGPSSETATSGSTPTTTSTATADPTSATHAGGTPSGKPTSSAVPSPGSTRPAPVETTIGATPEPKPGVTAEVSKIESVEGVAELPGDVGGPSLRVTVTVTNHGSTSLDLSHAVVNLYYGPDRTPADPLSKPGAAPFPDSVRAGGTADSVSVFRVPVDQRDRVFVELDLSLDSHLVVFEGPARG